jgi:hypothetical protein
MRIDFVGPAGSLAARPESALSALADIAVADGADREEWLVKALRSAGATEIEAEVDGEPRYQVVEDAVTEATALYRRVMLSMRREIEKKLAQAAKDADRERYRRLL